MKKTKEGKNETIIRETPVLCSHCGGDGKEPNVGYLQETQLLECKLCGGSGRIYIRETIFK